MKYVVILLLTFNSTMLFGQTSGDFMRDLSGKPVFTVSYTKYEGSPYLYNDFRDGQIISKTNIMFKEVSIRYDAYTDKLEYLKNDVVHTIESPISEFSIQTLQNTRVFRNGFNDVDKNTKNSFYEILLDDTLKLLKKHTALLYDFTSYNSATKMKKFVIEEQLYLSFPNGKMVTIKRDKKSMLDAFSDKRAEVDKFITDNKLKFRTDAEVAMVVDYYVSITTKS